MRFGSHVSCIPQPIIIIEVGNNRKWVSPKHAAAHLGQPQLPTQAHRWGVLGRQLGPHAWLVVCWACVPS